MNASKDAHHESTTVLLGIGGRPTYTEGQQMLARTVRAEQVHKGAALCPCRGAKGGTA
jgi:hypothetical protein